MSPVFSPTPLQTEETEPNAIPTVKVEVLSHCARSRSIRISPHHMHAGQALDIEVDQVAARLSS